MRTAHLTFAAFNETDPVYSDALDFSEVTSPRKIEAILQVSELAMGVNNGSQLNVILQRSIDGNEWVDEVSNVEGEFFKPVYIDMNANPVNQLQVVCLKDDRFLGNKLRFKLTQTQTDDQFPSVSTFTLSALVK